VAQTTAAFGGERGSGSILGLAIAGTIAAVLSVTLPLYMGFSVRESVAGAADASALAGADVASGIAPGSPCGVAATVAAANGASLVSCRVDGLVVTVGLERGFLGLQLVQSARAGPPGAVSN
jgi:secretion/DNA translocation related TadE-like protein